MNGVECYAGTPSDDIFKKESESDKIWQDSVLLYLPDIFGPTLLNAQVRFSFGLLIVCWLRRILNFWWMIFARNGIKVSIPSWILNILYWSQYIIDCGTGLPWQMKQDFDIHVGMRYIQERQCYFTSAMFLNRNRWKLVLNVNWWPKLLVDNFANGIKTVAPDYFGNDPIYTEVYDDDACRFFSAPIPTILSFPSRRRLIRVSRKESVTRENVRIGEAVSAPIPY